MFQPLSGPGFKVNKRAGTVAEVRAEIERRIAGVPGQRSIALPEIIPADRGRNTANWTMDLTGVPLAVHEIILAAMREFEIEEPGS